MSHVSVVFDYQDCFGTAGQFRTFAVLSRGRCDNLREVDMHGGPFSELTFDNDVSAALANNSITRSQAEPAAVTIVFGGKERFEETLFYVIGHSHAVVDHANADIFSRRQFRW